MKYIINTSDTDLEYLVKGEKVSLVSGKNVQVTEEQAEYIKGQLAFVKDGEKEKEEATVEVPEVPKKKKEEKKESKK